MALRLLVVEGNVRSLRDQHRAEWGMSPSEGYAAVLGQLAPDAACDIVFPADEGFNGPDGPSLEAYDGAVLTGSALHLWKGGPEVDRQISFMQALYRAKVPTFGSCWGIQVGAAAAGGTVVKNPAGREIGFARNIARTAAGEGHTLLAGRPAAYTAPAIHLDAVVTPPTDAIVLASNAMTPVQAAEIRHEGGTFWGVQYHPEFTLAELAVLLKRVAPYMVEEGFGRTVDDVHAYAQDLTALHDDRARADLAWKHGLDAQVLDDDLRLTEIRNFITHRVRPEKSRRGRA